MWKIACMAVALLMCLSGRAEAQFSMLIPSSSTVMEDKESSRVLHKECYNGILQLRSSLCNTVQNVRQSGL